MCALKTLKPRHIVLDVDDVLWDLNGVASRNSDIPYQKIVTYSARDNPLLSEDEKARLISAYTDPHLHETMEFFPYSGWFGPLSTMENVQLTVSSNCVSEQALDYKRRNLVKLFGPYCPYIDWQLHLIDYADSQKKKLDDDIWLIVDDSPHNMLASNAEHILAPYRPWNGPEAIMSVGGTKLCQKVCFYTTLDQCICHILELLASEKP